MTELAWVKGRQQGAGIALLAAKGQV